MRFDVFRCSFLVTTADFADHDDGFGFRVGLEQLQALDEIHAANRITTDTDTSGLSQTQRRSLMHGFIGQRSRTRNDTDLAAQVDAAGHDADLALVRRDDARAIRTDHAHAVGLQGRLDVQHVQHRDAFGDTDDQFNAGICRLKYRIRCKSRRHVDHRGIGPGLVDGFAHGIEYRQAQVNLATLARRHATDHFRAIGQRLLGMESTLLAGEALTEHLGIFVD